MATKMVVLKKIFLTCFLATSLAPSVSMAGYEEAENALQNGNYKVALKEFRALAKAGDARGHFGLGIMYNDGLGVPKDFSESAKWYRAAAEKGNSQAQNNLGLIYENGKGVVQSYDEAVKWYRAAVNQGHNGAKNNLGIMYFNGLGVEKNDEVAASCFMSAAKSGIAEAERNLQIVINNSVSVRATVQAILDYQRKSGGPLSQGQWGPREPRGLPFCG